MEVDTGHGMHIIEIAGLSNISALVEQWLALSATIEMRLVQS